MLKSGKKRSVKDLLLIALDKRAAQTADAARTHNKAVALREEIKMKPAKQT